MAFRSKARASSVPSSGRSVRRSTFQPSLPRLSSQRLAPDAVDAEAGRAPVARHFARRGLPVRRDDLQIRDGHGAVAVDLDARQPGEMAEAAGDRGLMLGCLHHGRDRVVAARTLAAAEIHLAVGNECLAIVTVGPGVGGGRMTCDQMIDRELVFDRAQRSSSVIAWSCRVPVLTATMGSN